MTYPEVMDKLKKMGTAQNRKVYSRHGTGEKLFGVSFANLNLLKKQIKTDPNLAQELWNSGNVDARHLATMIADPQEFSEELAESWVKDLNYYMLCDLLAGVVGKTRFARKKAEEWSKSDNEWTGRTGWDLIGFLAMYDQSLPDEYFQKYLDVIEKKVRHSKNFTKHSMGMAVIAIGLRNPSLEKSAVAAARRIGKIEVDHGQTSCQTPDIIDYIQKAKKRKKSAKKK